MKTHILGAGQFIEFILTRYRNIYIHNIFILYSTSSLFNILHHLYSIFSIEFSIAPSSRNRQQTQANKNEFEHSNSRLAKKLHWLPIDNRIVFKILLLTFKARAKLAPQYIQDLINDYTPQRNLRSGSKCLLETPNYNLESYGKRAFSVAAPRLWNSLPMELRTSTSIDIFKKKLKTYLFKQSYF